MGGVLDGVQTGLDVLGVFLPGIGDVLDGVNAVIYLARGDYVNAATSAAAMIPFAGIAATAGKFAMAAAPLVTAIGKMDDLLPVKDLPHVDTWWRSGRMPGPGEAPVTLPENKRWIQERIERGDEFWLMTDPTTLPDLKVQRAAIPGQPNGFFTANELKWLRKAGIEPIHKY